MKPLVTTLVITFVVLFLAACSQAPQATAEPTPANAAADRPRLSGTGIVEMVVVTSAGEGTVTLELDGERAPLTAGNFADLVQKGVYDGLTFHRVIPGFVAQGGDPLGNGTGGYVDRITLRPRQIPLEILVEGEDTPQYDTIVTSPVLTHTRGALAMARSQAPNSASSQFYITFQPQPNLDGSYAVFGYVTEGMDIVDQIQVGDLIRSATLVSGELEGVAAE